MKGILPVSDSAVNQDKTCAAGFILIKKKAPQAFQKDSHRDAGHTAWYHSISYKTYALTGYEKSYPPAVTVGIPAIPTQKAFSRSVRYSKASSDVLSNRFSPTTGSLHASDLLLLLIKVFLLNPNVT